MKYLKNKSHFDDYLKLFKESISPDHILDDIKHFCESHLAYLFDDGLTIDVTDDARGLSQPGDIEVILNVDRLWLDIREQIIPFLTHLKKEYPLSLIYNNRDWNIEFDINYNDSQEGYDTYWFNIDVVIDEGVGRQTDETGYNNNYEEILNQEITFVRYITFYIKK